MRINRIKKKLNDYENIDNYSYNFFVLTSI